MHIKELIPGTDDRMFFGGMTGTGKTTLMMKVLLQKFKQERNTIFIILDSGDQFEGQKARRLKWEKGKPVEITKRTNLNGLTTEFMYVYRVDSGMKDAYITNMFKWAFKHKQVCFVVDEVMEFSQGNSIHPGLLKLIKQGRKRHICLLLGSQRPSGIKLEIITESQLFAVFELINSNDRARFGDWIHPDFYEPVHGHDFRFFKRGMDAPVLIRQGKSKDEKAGKETA